jgi:spermidine synthase
VAVCVAIFIPLLWGFYGHAFKPPLDASTYFFKESDYYTIKLKKKDESTKGLTLEALVLDHLIHSYTALDDPLHLEYEYIRLYEELVRWQTIGKKTFRVLFIGGGGYTFPRFLEEKYPEAQIDVIEIDPEVSHVAKTFLGIPLKTRIRTFNEDARWFVMNFKESGSYDFIFGDAFNDLSIPYHLTTKEFAVELKRLLKPDGLYLANVIDSFKKGLFIPAYIRTLEEVFGKQKVNLVTANTDLNDMGISTYVVVASSTKLEQEDLIESMRRLGDTDVMGLFFPQSMLQTYLKDQNPVLLTDDYVPVDNLIAPIFEERYGYRK